MQAAAGWQGTTTAGLPPGQKLPTAHSCATLLTEPAGQPHPGAPLQLPLHAAVLLRGAARPKVPLGHCTATRATQ